MQGCQNKNHKYESRKDRNRVLRVKQYQYEMVERIIVWCIFKRKTRLGTHARFDKLYINGHIIYPENVIKD